VRSRLGFLGLLIGALLTTAGTARARDLYDEGDYRLELRSSFRSSLLLLFLPDDPILMPESPAGSGLFRLRFDLSANLSEYVTTAVAYEHRVRAASTNGVRSPTLPAVATAPFRLTSGDWIIVDDSPSYLHQHELDRAYVAVHLPFAELAVGRQAIGLGRGALFSAVDIFAPFSPTEIDREWRRGVDAINLDLFIPDFNEISGGFIFAFGPLVDGQLDYYAAIGSLRIAVGPLDAELFIGKRAEDDMVGLAVSATVGDAAVHAEGSMFGTDGQGIDGGFMGTDAVVAKGLAGGSYMFDVGDGLSLVLEYHYSGFGIANIGDDPSTLFDPAFQARFLRGDTQILGQHAISAGLSYPLFADLTAALSYIQSPVDGSGLLAPTLSWWASDIVTVIFNVTAPWGSGPQGGVPTSEYGSSPITIFLQARLYD